MLDLPDIQETEPIISLPIREVGVENVEVPFVLECKNSFYVDIVANVSIRTNLDENTKGISMSRLLLTLKPYLSKPLKHFLIHDILEDLQKKVGSTQSFIRFDFKMPKVKKSPLSDNEFPIFYKCKFEARLDKDEFKFYQGARVQYASYCPCSAGLCEHLLQNNSHGFPHAQRSYTDVLIQTVEPHYIWLEDIISIVEKAILTQPYPIIKRIDEQEIARIAGDNPMFVEDAIRAISKGIIDNEEIYDWAVKCSHEESIHTSEAIARNWKGIPNGFDEKVFI